MERRARDIIRQTAVISSAGFMLVAALFGSGVFGHDAVSEQQNGSLSDQGSYLAPAGPAFSIWSVIYLGLIVYVIWQALPGQRDDERQRAAGWWIAASMVLNGLWLVAARFGPFWSTVLVIVLLLVVLARVMILLGRASPSSFAQRVLLDGVNGLHFGWVTIATVANTAAWLTSIAPDAWGRQADIWGVGVLVAVAVICSASAWVLRRIVPALASAWGLVWLAVGRFTDEPRSTVIGVTAIVVAGVIVLVAAVAALRRSRRGAAVRR
ncbi:tryptophan-rich sensory protein [Microbacterium sp. NPDC058345]|uniref:tryptophan-rich sensory protein n=1 Tax=Microbacterium sp. NPDC058345 TaxID=3346455 RepID=UPI00366A2B1F